LLIGVLKLLKYVSTLEGFCEFTATEDDPFGDKNPIPQEMVKGIYEAIHGAPRPGFTPMFIDGHSKGLPGGKEAVIYPGTYHYLAGAIIHSAKTGIPLLNDIPDLPIPGIPDLAPSTMRSSLRPSLPWGARRSLSLQLHFCGPRT
jgi:hypothetical protein